MAFEETSSPLFSSFIHLSRYSRWLPEQGRREFWSETVQRYIDFFKEKHPKLSAEIQELYQPIHDMKVMPSMRALMTAGKALSRDHMAGYNCLSGNTLVTTKEYGIVPISTLAGQSVHVVDGNGEWTLSECKSYGVQQVRDITLSTSGKGSFSIRATGNHDWWLKDGSKKVTDQLEDTDSLASVLMPKTEVVEDEDHRTGVIHGLVYGDGTATYGMSQQKRLLKGFVIRLCSDAADLLPYFDGYKVSYPPSFDGQPVVYLFGDITAIDLKSLPDLQNPIFTDSYLQGFARGWFAADGSLSKPGQCSLACTKEGVDWIYAASPRTNFVPRSYREFPALTNLGERKKPLFYIELDRRYLTPDDCIIQRKKERFSQIDPAKYPGQARVASVQTAGAEEVFCFDVPTTHSFLLHKNILTGNCSFAAVDHPRVFDEILYVLCCGTGVGFSVERQFIVKLPDIAEEFHDSDTVISVRDSKIGWATALRELISLLFVGQVPTWDLSKIRPHGARLKTMGGRASGPDPLDKLFKFTVNLFRKAAGRKLSSMECHDLVCMIGDIVVVGGVRRSALISLSNLSDDRMRLAKSGQWWVETPYRALANNSAAYTEKPEFAVFLKEWQSLYESKSGERGIFNRKAAKKQASKNGRRNSDQIVGTNPCGEILLRPNELCNLSEVIVRPADDLETLKAKVRIATILGTLQSSLTDLRYVRKVWQTNIEEERLLGVSLTGITDHKCLGNSEEGDLPHWLNELKNVAIDTNKEWAAKLGINQSVAITCVKPSGTVSQLTDTASGCHPRFARHYLRRVRADKKDPLAQMMRDWGFPCEDDVMNPAVWIFSFPMKAPETAQLASETTAIQQLKLWKIYHDHWCEHNPSITVYYRDHEFMEVGNWVWNNFDDISGIAFLPYSDHTYVQAPYEAITEQKYEELLKAVPKEVDWGHLVNYETDDNTSGSQQLACSAGVCEVVDLVK